MDDLSKILQNRSNTEPPQVSALKKYAKVMYDIDIKVRISPRNYLIEVPGSSYAHKFRIESAEISRICELDKPLVIHIGY